MHPLSQVAIIGGHFNGTLTAIRLARSSAPNQIQITEVHSTPGMGRGLAYRFDDDNLLLNVPAGNMSALAEDPKHFEAYSHHIAPSLSSGSFLSRRLYRQYLQDLWNQTIAAHPTTIRRRIGDVTSLKKAPGHSGWEMTLASGQHLRADQVVLAVGPPRPLLPIPLESEAQSHVIDPWDFSSMHREPSEQPVVIVGTGQTAIDALFSLTKSPHQGPIYLLSRHGLFPHRHRLFPTAPKPQACPEYLHDMPPTARAYPRPLRQHRRAMAKREIDWRDALNELRPYTPQLWQTWPVTDQRWLLRHLYAYRDIHRHRLAPMAAQRRDQFLADGRAQVIAGQIASIRQQADGVDVAYRPRGSLHVEHMNASTVINCAGPDTNIQRHAPPLQAAITGGRDDPARCP